MKAMKGLTLSLLAFFIILASCEAPVRDNPSDKKSEEYDLEVSCDRAEGATVPVHEALVFTFSDTMVPSTLVVSGTANVTGADWSSAPWTESDLPGDTVTLNPRSLSTPGLWSDGATSTLTLQCSSVNGQTVTQSFTFAMVNDLDISTNTPEGAMVSAHEALSFTFKYDMVPGSLVVSGTGSISGADWTSADNWDTERKVLTLDPRGLTTPGLWAEGAESTLTLEATSVNGQTVSQSFSYLIENAVYVSIDAVNADDLNRGSVREPVKTIQMGINKAMELYPSAEIRVATGEYLSDYRGSGNPVFVVNEGYSIFGSYSQDFTSRNRSSTPSTVKDSSLSSGTAGDPNRAISALNSSISRSTVIDGFVIYVSGADDYSTGILCNGASPTIQNNEIINTGGLRDISGIMLKGSSAFISQNKIFEIWQGNRAESSFGIRIWDDSSTVVVIDRNWIYGGRVVSSPTASTNEPKSVAIEDRCGSIITRNNIFASNSGFIPYWSVGINVMTNRSIIDGNNIFCGDGSYVATCIMITGVSCAIDNNQFSQEENSENQFLYAVVAMDSISPPKSFSGNTFFSRFGGPPSIGNQSAYYSYLDGGFIEIINMSTSIDVLNESDAVISRTLNELGNSVTSERLIAPILN